MMLHMNDMMRGHMGNGLERLSGGVQAVRSPKLACPLPYAAHDLSSRRPPIPVNKRFPMNY